jgi:hypothetical protein
MNQTNSSVQEVLVALLNLKVALMNEHYFDMAAGLFDKVMRCEMSLGDVMLLDENPQLDRSGTDSVEAAVVEMMSSRQVSTRPLHMATSKSESAVNLHHSMVVPDWEVVSRAVRDLVESKMQRGGDVVVVHMQELRGNQAPQNAVDNLDMGGMDVAHADSKAELGLVELVVEAFFSCALAQSEHPP